MTREEAAELLDILKVFDAPDLSEAIEMAKAALREQETPCAACGYGGKHLDAPPCSTICPAYPKDVATNSQQEASNQQVTEPLRHNGFMDSEPSLATKNQVTSDSGSCKNCTDHSNCCINGNSWVSVKDRRPEYKTRVLFVDVRGLVFLAIDSVDWEDGRVSFLEPASGLWVQGSHWMPLPDAPQEV